MKFIHEYVRVYAYFTPDENNYR